MHGVTRIARAERASRPPASATTAPRYWAYFSYSHRDEADAKWLHAALEQYRVPRALVGRPGPHGPTPPSFAPIFRDRQELAAADNLEGRIGEAIEQSRFLIVLCSPAAAASRWTNQEIITFKRLHPAGTILAAIVAGEPFSSALPGREPEECFPPALRVQFDKRGRATGRRAEPLAADLRPGRDGRRLGLLKIVAAMLGLGLDDLVQREARRRQRKLTFLVAASLGGMAVTSGLALTAVVARDEARAQRREAEGLVGFMLGDLRTKLEPVGRLDTLDSVAARALAYFEAQDKGDLSDDALAQRSRALTLIGEMAKARGDLDGALKRYREAMAGTGEALERKPGDAQALFDHAQNVFWVGYIDWERGRTDRAAAAYREYKALAERMIAADPDNPKYRLEAIYADTNLGAVSIDQGRFEVAGSAFEQSLRAIEQLAAADPDNADYQKQLLESLAYLSEAREKAGRLEDAVTQRERQIALIEGQFAASADVEYRRKAMAAHRALGRLFASRGEITLGLEHARTASRLANELIRTEPANTEWLEAGAGAHLDLGALLLVAGDADAAAVAIRSGCDIGARLTATDRTVVAWREGLGQSCLTARARIALARGAAGEALALGGQALALLDPDRPGADPDRQFALARARRLVGDAHRALGQAAPAQREWRLALAAWPERGGEAPAFLATRAILYQRVGRAADVRRIAGRIEAMGYRHPEYLRALKGGN